MCFSERVYGCKERKKNLRERDITDRECSRSIGILYCVLVGYLLRLFKKTE